MKRARLYAWDDGSELYIGVHGNCNNTKATCNETSRTCHCIDGDSFWNLDKKMEVIYPDKFENIASFEMDQVICSCISSYFCVLAS